MPYVLVALVSLASALSLSLLAAPTDSKPPALFRTSDACIACHNQLRSSTGEDVSIGSAWRASMMAHSARDPYWQAAVRREVLDRPALQAEIEDECSTCHMPMARAHAQAMGKRGEVFAHLSGAAAAGASAASTQETRLAKDGVSCTLCHQISADRLGTPESFTGGFVIDRSKGTGERSVFGPFAIDRGHTTIMRSATGFVPTTGTHVQQSELCATCHTLQTHARDAKGNVLARLPEQVPYQEWLHSAYRQEKSCQACHMPEVAEPTPIVAVLGEPRAGLSRHSFRGGNFFMLEILNKYRGELGVEVPAEEMSAAARDTVSHLQQESAGVAIESIGPNASGALADGRQGGRLRFDVIVTNLAGHKLPTGYPSRRAWLHVTVRDRHRRVLFESGALQSDGRIAGNDADDIALGGEATFEPHHTEIQRQDEVQIYESMMVDAQERVTTGLLSGVRFAKDNRLLPRGFEKRTAAADIAVRGGAADDADFTGGGDRVRYVVDLGGSAGLRASGPFTIEAELWFQPIAYRWAQNLRPYDAPEPRRFLRYYDSMASSSGQRLAAQSLSISAAH